MPRNSRVAGEDGGNATTRPRKRRLSDAEVMAKRVYFIEGSDPRLEVSVRLGRPRKMRKEERYVCPVEIACWDGVRVRDMNGVDVFEALQVALILIGTELKFINERSNGALRWADGKRRDLAFPVYPDYSLVPIMSPAEGSIIDPAPAGKG